MPRARRDWTALRAEVRRLLREPDVTTSYWTDEELRDYWNQSMDQRVMELADQHEGWVTDRFTTDLVADQTEYTVPEGAGRIKRVVRRFKHGDRFHERPLERDERWGKPTWDKGFSGSRGSLPTYRLMGNKILLEPAPSEGEVAGIGIDLEFSPDRFDEDGDKLDLRFPDIMETLLIFDTAAAALGVELSQGNVSQGFFSSIDARRDRFASVFFQYTSERSFGRVFSQPYHLGD